MCEELRSISELTLEEKRELVDLVLQKKNGELDWDWEELKENFNLDISAETLRKAGVGVKLAMELREPEDVAAYKERQKIRDLAVDVRAMVRTESRSELLRETIAEAVKNLPPVSVRREDTVPFSHGRRELVLVLGDLHYGAYIHVEGLHGEVINHYDHKVFEERMIALKNRVIAICRKEAIGKINVMLVGDLLDGMLRQSQLIRLEYGIVDSTIRLSEFLSWWLAELSVEADVSVCAATGNHSEVRPLRSKAREFDEENLERIVLWYLESRLRDVDGVTVDAGCKAMTHTTVCGYDFLLLHGDGERNVEQIARDTVNLYGKHIDFFVCGHKHKKGEHLSGSTPDGNAVIMRAPSICGMDKYAQSKGYGGKAGALAILMNDRLGRECVYPITLS